MSKERIVGISLLVVAVMMVAQGVWFQVDKQAELDCQADYNAKVAEDRSALNDMIFILVNPAATDEDREAAIATYVDRARSTRLEPPDC